MNLFSEIYQFSIKVKKFLANYLVVLLGGLGSGSVVGSQQQYLTGLSVPSMVFVFILYPARQS
jgi:hypothetical protein